jgi:hypothetical protein
MYILLHQNLHSHILKNPNALSVNSRPSALQGSILQK